MFWELGRMELGDWHPRDIPDVLLQGAALRKQQERTLPPLEEWWFSTLHDGALPGSAPIMGKLGKLNTAFTRELRDDARERVPRLRDLSDNALTDFLTDIERIGVEVVKWRYSERNGWTFPPLVECRTAWEVKYGPVQWLVDVELGLGNWAGGLGMAERMAEKWK